MEPEIRYCTTSDGASIAYATMGVGPMVIMPMWVFSFAGRARVLPDFGVLCAAIAEAFTLVLYDGRGSGLSGRERHEFDLASRLLDLDAVARAVDAEAFALYGQGSSGLAAIAYAARNPERVTSLVLTNSFAGGERFWAESPAGQLIDSLSAVTADQWDTVSELIAARGLSADSDPSLVHAAGALLRETFSPGAMLAHRQATREIDVSAELSSIAVPTLVISNAITPFEQSRELAMAIPNAQLLRVRMSPAHWDERDYATLVSFLREHAAPVETAAASPASAPATAPGMVVVLFTDIVDSTALTERLGDTVFRTASRTLDEAMRAAMREAGGAPVDGKVLGDGVMGVFPTASQAITAARRCIELSAESELQLHIGLHAGDVIREKDNVYGGAVNIASRICGLSAPGEVLVSTTVRELARTSAGVEFEDRGDQEMKGVGDAVRVYAVQWR